MCLEINVTHEIQDGEDFSAMGFQVRVDPLTCMLCTLCIMNSLDSAESATPANLMADSLMKTWNMSFASTPNNISYLQETYTGYFNTNNLFHQIVNDHNIII